MNAQTKIEAPTGLALLRQPFPDHQISKLPKETKAQAEARKTDKSVIVWKCEDCGGMHHKNAVHLDYVGHAALTDRLLDCDPEWNWEPSTLPGLPNPGHGMWITLTVCGVSRLGYGAADGKQGGDAIKEVIGDALRNAAMRFGAALDLWHKGDLHLDADTDSGRDIAGEREISPPGNHHISDEPPPAKRENWGGRYPNKTAMRAARVTHHAELERLGNECTFDDLDEYLTSPEYVDYIAIATVQYPNWLEGELPEGALPEYLHTFKLEQKARDLIALRGNVPAGKE